MMEKQKNIPKLRFPEFDRIWEKKRLGEVVRRSGLNGSIHQHDYNEKEAYFYITNEYLKMDSSYQTYT
ncbi:MAG: hypothetical protein IPI60_05435 [Saprospiraceae bacterium]|nr:hypothetical protein [Saprospiraceae bacterium]